MLKVGSKFYTFDDLSRRLEEFQQIEQVQLWVRDSRTVVAAAKRARRKSLNPALKYAELTYSCVFGGRRPSDQAKTHNQTSAGGCPFKVRLSTSNDGQALVVKEICHDHNHEPGKKLHEEPRRLYRNKANSRAGVRKPVRYLVNKQRTNASTTANCLTPKTRLPQPDSSTTIRFAQSPFHHLQLHSQQQQQQIKLQLEQHLQQQRIRQQQLEEVVQLDSPDHIDTPDHLSSPDLSSSFEQLGNIITTTDQYSYLPPSPISPSLSSSGQTGYSSEEEELVEPILDLDVALEEALGDLDSVGSMDLEDKFALAPVGSRASVTRASDCEPSLSAVPLGASPSTSAVTHQHTEDPCAPPTAKRFRGRPRKPFTTCSTIGAPFLTSKNDDDEETDFIGFSPIKPQENTKGEQINEVDIAQADAMAKQLHVYKPGITFVLGAKLEVLDSRDNNWYQCRVVEVDWGELDILVHYERWSVRYDEWLKMDSTRIRPISLSKDKIKSLNFKVGEKVLGFWAPDSKYYLGQITKQSSEDYFEVLFYDGYTKTLRTSQLKKTSHKHYTSIDMKSSPKQLRHVPLSAGPLLVPSPGEAIAALDSPKTRRKSVPVLPFESPPASPEPPVIKEEADEAQDAETSSIKRNIFDVEILEKKRKTKRKPDVEQLFKSMKKKRKIGELSEFERRISSGKPSSAHRARTKIELREPPTPLSKPLEAPAFSTGEGMPGKRCNYLEVDVGHGWRKVCTRRTQGIWMGKWDVYFITSDGKKLRSRQELTKYCEDHPSPLKTSHLDFSVRSAKQMYDATKTKSDTQIKQEILSDEEVEAKPGMSKSLVAQSVDDEGDLEEEDFFEDDGDDMAASSSSSDSDASADSEPKVPAKDVVKKRQTSSSESETEAEASPEKQDVPSVKLSQLLSETLKVEEATQAETKFPVASTKELSSSLAAQPSGEMKQLPPRGSKMLKKEPVLSTSECPSKSEHSHKCPSRSCEKSFRKENLLQMHMKHYHPELLKRRSLQAPNVADLAYARTVGDHLDVASPSPSSVAYPPTDFALPEKKTEAGKKTKSLEMKKASEKKGKKSKDNKREKNSQEDDSDSEEGTNDPEELSAEVKEEEAEAAATGKLESTCRVEPDSAPKVKPPRRFQRERTVSRSETSKRRSRKSESMSEDDPAEKKPVKVRSSKQPQLDSVDPEEDNAETWTEAPADDYQDAIIHCGCNSQEEDGLMLQCDVCLTWQHGNCYSIESEDQVPEKYICFLCENPKGQRPSMRFRHHQEWLKEGKLPRFSFSTSEPNAKLESCIRRGHELSANVLQLSQLVYSLRLKLSISKEADHPKFVMWHKKWEEPSDDDKESQSLDPKWTQNVSENQLSPIHDLICSLSQSSSQPDPQVSYSMQDKTNSSPFGSYSSSSALLSTRSQAIDHTFQLPETENSSLVIEKDKVPQGGSLITPKGSSSEGNPSEAPSNDLVPHEGFHPSAPKPEATDIKVETDEIPSKPNPELPVDENTKHVTRREEENDQTIKSNPRSLSGESDQLYPSIQEGLNNDGIPKEDNEITKPPIIEENASNEDPFPEIVKKGEEDRPEVGSESTSRMKGDKAKKDPFVEKTEDLPKSVDASSHDSLDDPEDLDLALGALGDGAVTSINDGLVDLLSSHPEFEQLVDGSELAPLVPNPMNVPPAPIIPKYERIEPVNCKLNLLKHVEVLQDKTTKRFDYIENQLKALEAEMGLSSEISREEEELLVSDGVEGRDAVTLQARALVKLILNDLDIVKQMADFSDTQS